MADEQKTETGQTPGGDIMGAIGGFFKKNTFGVIGALVGLLAMAINPVIGIVLALAGLFGGSLLGDKEHGVGQQAVDWVSEGYKKLTAPPERSFGEKTGEVLKSSVEGVFVTGLGIKAAKSIAPKLGGVTKIVTGPLKWAKDVFMTGLSPLTWVAKRVGLVGTAGEAGLLARGGGWLVATGRTALAWGSAEALPAVGGSLATAGTAIAEGATAVAGAVSVPVVATGTAIAAAILSPFAIYNAVKWNEIDNTFKPDMKKFGNALTARGLANKYMEGTVQSDGTKMIVLKDGTRVQGGIAEPDGKYSLINPATAQRNLTAFQAAIQAKKEEIQDWMEKDENKPAFYTRILAFTEAQGNTRTAYENKKMDLRQLENAEQELPGYMDSMYAYAKSHQAEMQRFAAAAEQVKQPVTPSKPVQTITSVTEPVAPGLTPAAPKSPLKQATVTSSAAGNLPIKQATVSRDS